MRPVAATLAVLALATVAGSDSARAAFPASHQRLVVLSEDRGFALPALVLGKGDLFPFGLPLGIHGTAAISPDGTQAALVETISFFPGQNVPALLVGGLLGGGQVLNVGKVTGRATWSPDGTKVAFAANNSGNWDIYAIGLDNGAVPVDLTPASPAADIEPRWSPDGTKIAFQSDRTGNIDVYTMNPDGSAVADLTGDPARDTLGDWSPDSQQLVFTSTRTGNGDLYLTSRSGGAVTRLTTDDGADTRGAWSPDGATIAYSSDADGDNDAFRIAPDGSGADRVTDNTSEDLVQDWQPLRDLTPPKVHALAGKSVRGRKLVFRFTITESSGEALVDLSYQYRTRNGSTFTESSASFGGLRGGHVYRFTLPADAGHGVPASFRFCVGATDGSANASKRSCATYHLLPKKKKR
jgi:dipeptidyl aminopeptidase/acylaminoacyl peptidase